MIKTAWTRCAVVIFSAILAGTAAASPFIIFGTGLDSGGIALAGGASDPHYLDATTSTQAKVLTSPPGSYFPNNALSEWVWENANGQPVNVTRTFRTTFDLTGFDPNSAVINGQWGVDNEGLAIRLNGNVTGITLPGVLISNFSSLHAFTISNAAFFQAGVNTLEFDVKDDGGVAGFRAQLSGTANAAVPEPATLALLGVGLAGLAATRRRKLN